MVKSQLARHLLMHSGEKPYHCTESGCPYQTRTQSELTTHIKKHSGDLAYCDIEGCSFSIVLHKNVARHKSTVHSTERPFKCDLCCYRGKTKDDMYQHSTTHSEKTFKCDLWGHFMRYVCYARDPFQAIARPRNILF